MKPKYEMKVTDDMKTKKFKEQEEQLKDLLSTIPTLKKHGISAEIEKKVRQLRNGRKAKAFTLELSRKYNGQTISVKAPVEKTSDKFAILRELKNQIRMEIQKRRKENREFTVDAEGNKIPVVENCNLRYGLTVKRQDMTYLEEGSFLKALMKKIRNDMTKSKSPQTTDNYLGIEIELAAKENRETLCDKIFDAGLGKHITVKDDGSIGDGGRQGFTSELRKTHPHTHEICILVRQSEFEDVIKRLCKVFKEQLNVAVDRTCGLHVHVDMRSRDVAKAFSNLVLSQQFLYAMLPAQRRSSQYSYPVKGNQWRDLDSRYHGINQQAYRKYKTLELRMHSGTTNDTKIINWIKLLLAIVDAPAVAYAPTSVEAFQTMIGFDATVLNYVKSRIAKFAEQHKKTTPSAEQPGTMPNVDEVRGALRDETALEASEVA